jgi:ectoine hydroxylase-related dioxygenase (phytanoyl-CoA dioxygenase family)
MLKNMDLRSQQSEALCIAAAGDALLMRPLLLHASSRSTSPNNRRVLHIEYAAFCLPTYIQQVRSKIKYFY